MRHTQASLRSALGYYRVVLSGRNLLTDINTPFTHYLRSENELVRVGYGLAKLHIAGKDVEV
jgi:hypothetical protein